MPADIFVESDDSEFSEADWSVHGHRRASGRRRSHSRPRRTEVRETLTVPMPSTRVHRSASTGGRRHRDRSPVPAVVILNEQAQRTDNSNSNKPRRVQQKVIDHDFDEEVIRSRRRAVSGVSRDPSPFHHERDAELALNQKLLEKSDLRQDLEIWKQQQEIERLERELEKHRERPEPRDSRESRLLREEEEWYEDEISDRLRRLERYDRKNRAEEERHNVEKNLRLKRLEEQEREAAEKKAWRLKRLEEAEKEAAEREEMKQKLREEKLKEIVKQKEEEEERQRLRKEFVEEERRRATEAEEKKKKEQAMKNAAIEEWKLEQERIKLKQKEEAIKKDKEFRERLRLEFGYTEDEIEEILNKKKKAEKEKEKKEKEKKEKKDELIEEKSTWIKVHRKHLLPETLLAYNLPWDWDERDSNYIIIKRWITEDFQEELFSHTRRIREGKLVAQTSSSTTELRINDRGKDKMYLVRKKSPSRRLRMFV